MIKTLAALVTVFTLSVLAFGQDPAAAPTGPQAKSQEELNAMLLCQQAPDSDLRIES